MALAVSHTFADQETHTHTLLNAIETNITNNANALISPFTGSVDVDGFDVTDLDELEFRDADADASATGRLRRTNQHLEWHDATGSWPLQLVVGGGIFGLTISNDGTDVTNDIQVTAGQAIDDTEIYTLRLTSTLIKRLDAVWAVGTNQGMLDTGVIANDTYHIFIIKRSDTGVTDILASLSAGAPTMPASYDFKRRIGAIMRVSAAIVLFTQDGDYFRRSTATRDVAASANPGTAAVTVNMTGVPTGIILTWIGAAHLTTGAGGNTAMYVSDLAATDEVPTRGGVAPGAQLVTATTSTTSAVPLEIRLNTARQLRYRLSFSDADVIVNMYTYGWRDRRGQDS